MCHWGPSGLFPNRKAKKRTDFCNARWPRVCIWQCINTLAQYDSAKTHDYEERSQRHNYMYDNKLHSPSIPKLIPGIVSSRTCTAHPLSYIKDRPLMISKVSHPIQVRGETCSQSSPLWFWSAWSASSTPPCPNASTGNLHIVVCCKKKNGHY